MTPTFKISNASMEKLAGRGGLGLLNMPVEIIHMIVRCLVPEPIGWDRNMDFWPSNFLKANDYIDTCKEMDEPTSLRDHPLRVEYMAGISSLTQLALTCRTISFIAREALYSRVRIDNRKALVRLTASLSKNTNTMRVNAGFIKGSDLDMDLEDRQPVSWFDLGQMPDKELDVLTGHDLAPYKGRRLEWLFDEPTFSICPSLRLLAQVPVAAFWQELEAVHLGPAKVVFFAMLCYLPALRTLTLRFPETHRFIHDLRQGFVLGSYTRSLPFYRTLFDFILETQQFSSKAAISYAIAPAGNWPCPSLEKLEVYGQPFPWDCSRSVSFLPAWSFHTIPGLKSLKIMAMGHAAARSVPETDDFIEHPNEAVAFTGFQPEHMRACMENLTHLELHNTPFQFTTFHRALAEAKNLKSLTIHIDIANIPDDLLLDEHTLHWNILLPLCADTLENLNLLLSCSLLCERTQQFFFGPDRKLICLHNLPKLKTVRVNLSTLFGASRTVPNDFEERGVDYEGLYDLINAVEDIQLPESLGKLILVEERDARVYWETLIRGEVPAGMLGKIEADISVQQGMYSEQLKRFAAACRERKARFDWGIKEVDMLSWWPVEGDPEAGLDREGVAEAFDRVPGLGFSWGWLDEEEISLKETGF